MKEERLVLGEVLSIARLSVAPEQKLTSVTVTGRGALHSFAPTPSSAELKERVRCSGLAHDFDLQLCFSCFSLQKTCKCAHEKQALCESNSVTPLSPPPFFCVTF